MCSDRDSDSSRGSQAAGEPQSHCKHSGCTSSEQRRPLYRIFAPQLFDLPLAHSAQPLDADVLSARPAIDNALIDDHAICWDAAKDVRKAETAG
eukprot:CAMPEP_0119309294 /NCGR_PEP_ID=MMETSP1333-20130426/14675_1 /TAXON_ID=418940 /ORGANISM="Scyphosphaera apsteinii, Strain RCC1455" /LENGTH=93 /DNA_ID=CAMNT_0007313241 /DNA_START=203 /DNA_END=484 /DNA_ORIENTATION=-